VLALVVLFAIQVFSGDGGDADSGGENQAALDFDFGGIDHAGYVDLSGVFADEVAMNQDLLIAYPDEASAESALDAGEVDVFYVIPDNYLETGDIRIVTPRFELGRISEQPFQQLFYSQFADQVEPSVLQRLAFPTNLQVIDVTNEEEVASEDANMTLVQLFSIVLFLSLVGTSGYLLQSVIEEKESRLIEILLASVRPNQLLAGKILATGLVGLLTVVVYLGAIVLAITLAAGDNPLAQTFFANLNVEFDVLALAVIFFIFGYLVFGAVFGAIGAVAGSLSQASGYTSVFVLLALSPWFLANTFVVNPDGFLSIFLSMFPLTSPIGMVLRYSVADVPTVQIVISIVILILTVIGMMWFAGRLFRVQTLLSGRAPRLRDIPALVRG
jgi:ABC-2 type transport system permease protein